jgi:hypothetical protein
VTLALEGGAVTQRLPSPSTRPQEHPTRLAEPFSRTSPPDAAISESLAVAGGLILAGESAAIGSASPRATHESLAGAHPRGLLVLRRLVDRALGLACALDGPEDALPTPLGRLTDDVLGGLIHEYHGMAA